MKLHKSFKILVIIVAFVLLFSACLPSDVDILNPPEGPGGTPGIVGGEHVALAYNHTDSLNPFTARTRHNQRLSRLLFDSLVTLDENFEPHMAMAESIEQNGRIFTVRLRNLNFTNGRQIVAQDVIFSLNLAKNQTNGPFFNQTQNIREMYVLSPTQFTITLYETDRHFINNLDIPIISRLDVDRQTEDGQALPPIGSGRYIYEKVDGASKLTVNENFRGETPRIEQILLVSTPDDEALEHNLAMGVISIYYSDLFNTSPPRMPGNVTSNTLNALVFLGFNHNTVNDANVRSAINLLIDRTSIMQNNFQTHAAVAATPFNPAFHRYLGTEILNDRANPQLAGEKLRQAGFNSEDEQGFLLRNNQRLSLRLIVNEENTGRVALAENVALKLRNGGLAVTVIALPFAQYTQRLNTREFDLFLAEVNIPLNFDMREILLPTGAASAGLAADCEVAEAYLEYREDEITTEQFLQIFERELPILPLIYRNGILLFSNRFQGVAQASPSDIYYNLESLGFE